MAKNKKINPLRKLRGGIRPSVRKIRHNAYEQIHSARYKISDGASRAFSKGVKILVTAGPTWIRLGKVRVLTNIFSGRTGFLIAKIFKKSGFRVKLLLGSSKFVSEDKGLDIIRFKYFGELKDLVRKELEDKSYKVVIHSAAVSDYKPYKIYKGKISSSKEELVIKLKPTLKIIRKIRRQRQDIFLIQFKLEVGKSKKSLIDTAYKSLIKNNSDLVVANDLEDMKGSSYRAYIIDKNKNIKIVRSREELAQGLLGIVNSYLRKVAR